MISLLEKIALALGQFCMREETTQDVYLVSPLTPLLLVFAPNFHVTTLSNVRKIDGTFTVKAADNTVQLLGLLILIDMK